MSVSVREALTKATHTLEAAGVETAPLDAMVLLLHVLRCSKEDLLRTPEKSINPQEKLAFDKVVTRREKREPVAQITGKREFWGLDFIVTPDTLIPRPDSETLIEAVLRVAPDPSQPMTILDMGTGSGCLLITLLREFPESNGVGLDISIDALHVARRNAAELGVNQRAAFICGSWGEALKGTFDLVISNPPYIAETDAGTLMPDVVRFEPHTALFAGADGLHAYRHLARDVSRLLKKGGHACFEIGQGQADSVSRLLEDASFTITEIRSDLAGISRCVVARLN